MGAIQKFQRLGLKVEDHEIITSRDAELAALTLGIWGAIAADEDSLADIDGEVVRLVDDEAMYDRVDGFLFLSSAAWTDQRQSLLASSLVTIHAPS